MIEIDKYLQALRRHDFRELASLIPDIAAKYLAETKKPIAADELQDCLLYLFVRSDLSFERDWSHIVLVNQLVDKISMFKHDIVSYNLTQLVGAFLAVIAIKTDDIKFEEQSSYQSLKTEISKHTAAISKANHQHIGELFQALEKDYTEESLIPYRLKEALEEKILTHVLKDTDLAQKLIDILAQHERITPYLALYLIESHRRLSTKLTGEEKKLFRSVFSTKMLSSLKELSQTREAFAEGLSCDLIASHLHELLETTSGGVDTLRTKVSINHDTQVIRFFTPAIQLVKAGSVKAMKKLPCP